MKLTTKHRQFVNQQVAIYRQHLTRLLHDGYAVNVDVNAEETIVRSKDISSGYAVYLRDWLKPVVITVTGQKLAVAPKRKRAKP